MLPQVIPVVEQLRDAFLHLRALRAATAAEPAARWATASSWRTHGRAQARTMPTNTANRSAAQRHSSTAGGSN